jgi:hypothetical protein
MVKIKDRILLGIVTEVIGSLPLFPDTRPQNPEEKMPLVPASQEQRKKDF